MCIDNAFKDIKSPKGLCSKSEIFAPNCPIPKGKGLYALYFKDIPQKVPTIDCIKVNGLTLFIYWNLY